jgi:hypothetical protein
MYWVLSTGKLISNSGFFPCLLLSAERQALGPLVLAYLDKAYCWFHLEMLQNVSFSEVQVSDPLPLQKKFFKNVIFYVIIFNPFTLSSQSLVHL